MSPLLLFIPFINSLTSRLTLRFTISPSRVSFIPRLTIVPHSTPFHLSITFASTITGTIPAKPSLHLRKEPKLARARAQFLDNGFFSLDSPSPKVASNFDSPSQLKHSPPISLAILCFQQHNLILPPDYVCLVPLS
jgi:hypothetical protein